MDALDTMAGERATRLARSRKPDDRADFAHYGGACPLWNVHEAFDAPDRILVQMTKTPDSTQDLSMATYVTKAAASYGAPRRRYAIGFGCEFASAENFIYADGLDWKRPRALTPIGVICRLCDHPDCAQRAFPPVGRRLTVDQDTRLDVPYGLPPPQA